MQNIPSTLLEKVKKAIQTVGSNADPKMDVIAQKANKYLTQGNLLQPQTIRTGNSLGAIDICVRRENKNAEPSEIVMVYIENGQAKVATLPYAHTPDQTFKYQYTVGPATDVACDFDGDWFLITDRTGIYVDTTIIWSLVTTGEPYFALVNNGILTVRQGQGSPITLVETGATKCQLLRGWKNINFISFDHGLVCAYIKDDGKVYYRNYARQDNGSIIWEVEREVTQFTPPVQNIGLFRTNDYRTGFLAEIGGQISWALTKRNWAGMAVAPENISIEGHIITDFIKINSNFVLSDENITISTEVSTILLYGATNNLFVSIENVNDGSGNFGLYIVIVIENELYNINILDFTITIIDQGGTTSVLNCVDVSKISDKNYRLTFPDFNTAVGDIELKYTASVGTNEAGYKYDPFSGVFMPIGLIPPFTPIPEVEAIWNE